MRINRGLLFWGLALVIGGGVALAAQQGYIDREVLREAWRLWPLILVAIGLAIILGRTPFSWVGTVVAAVVVGIAGGALLSVGPAVVSCGGSEPTAFDTGSGTFGGTASVGLDFNCGTLAVGMAGGNDWSARTGSRGDRSALVDAGPNALKISAPDGGWGLADSRQRWEVTLGSAVRYDLDVSANAAETVLDLRDGSFSRLRLDPNAGSVRVDLSGATLDDLQASVNAGSLSITVDGATQITGGAIEANAASVELCTAPGTAIRISSDSNFTFSHNLDDAGLSRSGDSWTSAGFDGAQHTITLSVDGNAASFTLNPSGGCS